MCLFNFIMKHFFSKLFSLFLVLAFSFQSKAQVVVVSNLKQNVVYLGINNPLKIAMEGVSCNGISVRTDNGKLIKTGSCEYEYHPERKGMAQIIVKSAKKTYNYLLRVETMPQPIAFIGGSSGGLMSKTNFTAQQGIYLRYPGFDTKTGLKISSYHFQIIREGKYLFGGSNSNPYFNKEMVQYFAHLMKNDLIIFYSIIAEDEDGNLSFVPPIQFIIN